MKQRSQFIVITLLLFMTTSCATQNKRGNKIRSLTLEEYDDGVWKHSETTQAKESISFDCMDLISTKTDRVTGRSSTESKLLVISDDGAKSGFTIYVHIWDNLLILSGSVLGGSYCMDKHDINILFRDGTRLLLMNHLSFNCDGRFSSYFSKPGGGYYGRNNKQILEMFRTKEVETMRIGTSRGSVQRDFTSIQSKQLMKSIDCMLNLKNNKKT